MTNVNTTHKEKIASNANPIFTVIRIVRFTIRMFVVRANAISLDRFTKAFARGKRIRIDS